MAYPPSYEPTFDLAQAQQNGDVPSATELASELANIGDSINQVNAFLRAFATADKRIKPNTVVGSKLVEEQEITATAGQTDFLFTGGVTVDPAVASVAVYVEGERLDPSNVTVQTDRVVIAAQSAGNVVTLDIHDNADSILADLASTAANLGASLVGVEDIQGLYAADSVEDALAEVRSALNDFIANVGNLNDLVKRDGSVPFTGNADFGNNKLVNVKAGTADTDGVNFKQLTDTLDQLTSLTDKFLPRTGGAMQGAINMTQKRLVNLPTPTASEEAANKKYVDDNDLNIKNEKLSLAGTADAVTRGTMNGPATYGQTASQVADSDQTTDPESVSIPTWHGIPQPGADDHVANKRYVDSQVAVDSVAGDGGDGVSDSVDACATGPDDEPNFGVPTNIGYYEFIDVNWDGVTLPIGSIYRISGSATLTGTISLTKLPPRRPEFNTPNQGIWQERNRADFLQLLAVGAQIGGDSTDIALSNNDGVGGGGSYRTGGRGDTYDDARSRGGAGLGLDFNVLHNYWGRPLLIVGGAAGSGTSAPGSDGGGGVVLMVSGDLDLSDCVIDANGNGGDGGGGGGGGIWILCSGTITTNAGTRLEAAGGSSDSGEQAGGGAGGVIVVAASAFAGPGITTDVSGGPSSDAGPGPAGWADVRSENADHINSLIRFYGASAFGPGRQPALSAIRAPDGATPPSSGFWGVEELIDNRQGAGFAVAMGQSLDSSGLSLL